MKGRRRRALAPTRPASRWGANACRLACGAVASAVLALSAAGCGPAGPGGTPQPSPGQPSGTATRPGTTAARPSTEPATTPRTEPSTVPKQEGTGPEQPQRRHTDEPAISVASLPIGGNDVGPATVPQCAQANWLGQGDLREIPPGVRVVVTSARTDSDRYYTESSPIGCEGRGPLCRGFAFTSVNDDPRDAGCFVGVTPTGERSDTDTAFLLLAGNASCPPAQAAFCRLLTEDGNGGSIALNPPLPEDVDPSSPTEQPTDPGSSSGSGG